MKYDDKYMNDQYMDDQYMDDQYMDGEDMQYTDECGPTVSPLKKKMIEVEEVVGIGSAETTVEICIPLRPPAFEVIDELITKDVIFDALIASKGKVFVNGRVIKDIPFKTKVKRIVPGCPAVSKLTFGDIRHVTAEIPFALCIDIPEAKKGMKVVVLDVDVNSIEIPNHTNCLPNKCVAKCEPAVLRFDTCLKRPFCSLTEKDCIFVKVKVVKDAILTVNAEDRADF